MDESYAKKIKIILTTTTKDSDVKIEALLKSFYKVQIIHGYKHSEISSILQGANLGVIPVVWEDNLPQVAIEMVANGVPILSSDAGGASELCQSELFRFKSGNKDDFLEKLMMLIDKPELLDSYWEGHTGLTTMDMHFDSISMFYGLPKMTDGIELSMDEYKDILEENEFLYNHFSGDERYVPSGEFDRLNRENGELRRERDEARWRLDETWKSKSFKIGRMITAIPRKLRVNLDR